MSRAAAAIAPCIANIAEKLFPFVPPAGRSTFGRLAMGRRVLVMPLPTRSYISAVTLVLQCTSGNAVLAQEGQVTTAIASANDRGDACTQSIEKVINLCIMRGLNRNMTMSLRMKIQNP